MNRRVCVVTGSRADYGLLRWVMQGIKDDQRLTLQVIATGMHLSPEFGLTYTEIEKDGFIIDRKVEMLLSSDTPVGITKSMGLAMTGFADALHQLQPNILIVLGDRFEILCAVSAALVARIPVAHLHGGEASEGVIDEAIRHSITKMSHLHFVSAKEYYNRVIQLGEQPENVFLVGGVGIDSIKKIRLLERPELEDSLGFRLGQKNLLVTFHPVTLENSTAEEQMIEVLASLEELEDTCLIFTFPNADTDGRVLIKMIENFSKCYPNAYAYASLGQLGYLSCLQYVDGAIGNSSSGLIEVPTFKKGTINIGDRQKGRLKASSVIDCPAERKAINQAIKKLYSSQFQDSLLHVENPYGNGGASEKIVNIIKQISLDKLLKKSFYNLPISM